MKEGVNESIQWRKHREKYTKKLSPPVDKSRPPTSKKISVHKKKKINQSGVRFDTAVQERGGTVDPPVLASCVKVMYGDSSRRTILVVAAALFLSI